MTHQIHTPWYRRPAVQIIATVVVTGLAGLTGGAQLGEPQRVTETRVVAETPAGCIAALDEADRALVVGVEFGRAMVGLRDVDQGVHHFSPGGLHDQDSRRFLETMTAAAETFRPHKTACLAPPGGANRG